ncbi:hypothetical protein ACPZJD_006344 [Pseudomonas aeruginosa]
MSTSTIEALASAWARIAEEAEFPADYEGTATLRIPRPSGHPFHEHLATDSTVIRPPVPRASGH